MAAEMISVTTACHKVCPKMETEEERQDGRQGVGRPTSKNYPKAACHLTNKSQKI